MCTQFISKTHLVFTGGKDGKIKQWDADSFEHIVTLQVQDFHQNALVVLFV
jgi:U3 small nucleolar RNA-associated protein 12